MESKPQVLLGRKVRLLRTKLDWSQERLAEKADLHWTYISGIERGIRNVAIANIAKIAKALNVSVSKLTEDIR